MLAMSELCIFCDAPLSNSALQLLMQGVAPHELGLSQTRSRIGSHAHGA